MPELVYRPEGAEPRTWDFNPTKLMSPEVMAIEKLTGMTFGEWQHALRRDSITAYHALLYIYLKRQSPTIRPSEVVFSMSEIDIEVTEDEARRALDEFEKIPVNERDADDWTTIGELRERLGLDEVNAPEPAEGVEGEEPEAPKATP